MKRRVHLVAVGALTLAGAFTAEARADQAGQVPVEALATARAAAPVHRAWYGAEILPMDALALAAPFIAASLHDSTAGTAAITVGMLGYFAGGPIVHGLNDRGPGVVLGSLGLRLGVPVLGAVIGGLSSSSAVASCDAQGGKLCGLTYLAGAYIGAYAGMALASILDIAALSWTDPNRVPDAPADPAQPLHVVPVFGMTASDDGRHRVPTFGVAGTL